MLEAMQTTMKHHPSWTARQSFFHPLFAYRLFFVRVEHREVGDINLRFQKEFQECPLTTDFAKVRELVWVDAEEFLQHYRSNDGALFIRLQKLQCLDEVIQEIQETYKAKH